MRKQQETITAVGMVGLKVDGYHFVLNPSLNAMTRIDNPVKAYVALHDADDIESAINVAYDVLLACSNDAAIETYFRDAQKVIKKPRWSAKRYTVGVYEDQAHIAPDTAIILARHLLYHGLIGDVKRTELDKKAGAYNETFDALAIAASAQAGLGVSSSEAWSMTMTSIARAMLLKYPKDEKQRTQESILDDYEAMLAWSDEVNELRGG